MVFEYELDAVLQEIVAGWDIPGLAVGIVQGDQITYAKGFGVQSLETGTPVTLDSVFCTASVSKCFVGTAVMQLAERGKIDLDAPVLRYLPYFELDDPRYRQITIQQILSHTSGMPDMDEFDYTEFMSHPEVDDGAAERYVRALRGRKMIADPGAKFSYSNIAYNVLGDLIAKVSGKPFEHAIREQLLLPAGMTHSTFLLSEVPPASLAVPHLRSPEMRVSPFYPYHRADAPASFLHATVVDMCRWGITLLNRGLLNVDSYRQMWSPVADRGYPPPSMYEKAGLGWTLGHFKGFETVSHGGMGFGWADFFFLMPEKKCAGVVLCNEESYARTRIVHALADVMIGQKPQANKVSWMIPVSRALAQGGVSAAHTRAVELLSGEQDSFYVDADELINLSLELFTARQPELAIGVLEMSLQFFPDQVDTALELARLYLREGKPDQADRVLVKVLEGDPENTDAKELRKEIWKG